MWCGARARGRVWGSMGGDRGGGGIGCGAIRLEMRRGNAGPTCPVAGPVARRIRCAQGAPCPGFRFCSAGLQSRSAVWWTMNTLFGVSRKCRCLVRVAAVLCWLASGSATAVTPDTTRIAALKRLYPRTSIVRDGVPQARIVTGSREILRTLAQQQVPDTTANEKGLVTGILEPVEDFQSALRDVGPRSRMFRARHDQWRGPVRCPYRRQKPSNLGIL